MLIILLIVISVLLSLILISIITKGPRHSTIQEINTSVNKDITQVVNSVTAPVHVNSVTAPAHVNSVTAPVHVNSVSEAVHVKSVAPESSLTPYVHGSGQKWFETDTTAHFLPDDIVGSPSFTQTRHECKSKCTSEPRCKSLAFRHINQECILLKGYYDSQALVDNGFVQDSVYERDSGGQWRGPAVSDDERYYTANKRKPGDITNTEARY